MKNITLSADEAMIERAREIARDQHRSLNDLFRDWLSTLDDRHRLGEAHLSYLRERASVYCTGVPCSRDEMNER